MKKFSIGLLVGALIMFVGGKILDSGIVESKENENVNVKDLYFLNSDGNDYYFLDVESEYENVIYIDKETLYKWYGKSNYKQGEKVKGVFDPTGWEWLGSYKNG